jgi:hypothetical protein
MFQSKRDNYQGTNTKEFDASAAMLMRSAFFWDITQRRMVILYRRFGTTYWSHLPIGPIFKGQEVQE